MSLKALKKKKLVSVPPMTEEKKPAKPAGAMSKALEKARAARKGMKIRSYNDSAAGHCEDRLRRISKFLQKVYVRTSGWSVKDGVANADDISGKIKGIDQALTEAGGYISAAIDNLKQLAQSNFKPKLRARGIKKLEVTPGMRVWLKPEAYAELLKEGDFTAEQLDKLILSKLATNADKLLYVRVEKNEPGAPIVGYVHRKNLSATRPDYSEIGRSDDEPIKDEAEEVEKPVSESVPAKA